MCTSKREIKVNFLSSLEGRSSFSIEWCEVVYLENSSFAMRVRLQYFFSLFNICDDNKFYYMLTITILNLLYSERIFYIIYVKLQSTQNSFTFNHFKINRKCEI